MSAHESLQEQITQAFADLSRPALDSIALHECEECAELRTALAPYDWHDVPDPLIETHASALPLLSPAALAYYLPAYLLYGLRHFSPEAEPTQLAIYYLTPKADVEDDEDRAEHRRAKLRYFTRAQIDAVAAFLDAVAANEPFRVYLGDVEPGRRRLLRLWERRWDS